MQATRFAPRAQVLSPTRGGSRTSAVRRPRLPASWLLVASASRRRRGARRLPFGRLSAAIAAPGAIETPAAGRRIRLRSVPSKGGGMGNGVAASVKPLAFPPPW